MSTAGHPLNHKHDAISRISEPTSENPQNANFAKTEFSEEVSRRTFASGIICIVGKE